MREEEKRFSRHGSYSQGAVHRIQHQGGHSYGGRDCTLKVRSVIKMRPKSSFDIRDGNRESLTVWEK